MKIITWNINGIRAIKPPIKDLIKELDVDILCLQETKVTRDQLDEQTSVIDGYNSYFSFSKGRSGYSGVATFVRDSCTPVRAEEGLTGSLTPDSHDDEVGRYGNQSYFSDEELQELDREGRAVLTQHRAMDGEGCERLVTFINVYCPRADRDNEDRLAYKMRFYRLLQIRAEAILKGGSQVVVLGDINMSHTKLDHCDPGEDAVFFGHPGRKWLTEFLWEPDEEVDNPIADTSISSNNPTSDTSFGSDTGCGHQFVDSFRVFHPGEAQTYTCWETRRGSRATNYGVRIDYILPDLDLFKAAFVNCELMREVEGSDHCPVRAELNWSVMAAKKCPALCTKHYPEFAGKQQKLSSFFTKKAKTESSSTIAVSSDDSTPASSQGSVSSEKVDTTPVNKTDNNSKLTFPAKRSSTELPKISNSPKRLKKDSKAATSGKQGNLLSFFSKPNQSKSDSKNVPKSTPSIPKTTAEATVPKSSTSSAAASWKSLLSGPPPPPMCTGHREPCLLRTVKKQDSANKGRQFWVCPRPEGHKTNKEARCDTFLWVDKKKT